MHAHGAGIFPKDFRDPCCSVALLKGFTKTLKKGNLAIEEREAREKREPQASQATENTRREARTTRRTRAQGHEEQQSRRGEGNASIKIASRVVPLKPLARPLRGLAGRFKLGAFRALL